MELSTKQFFIIGAQRSGTTMLQLMLNKHSKIAVVREAEFLIPFLKKKYLRRPVSGCFLKTFYFDYFLTVKDDVKFSYAPFNKFFSQLHSKKLITLKDMIDGMFSLYCRSEGKSIWGNKTPLFIRRVDILHKLFPEAKFIHIVRDGRDVFDSRRKLRPIDNDIIINAFDWSYKIYRIDKSFKKIPVNNKMTIRYENLLENPESTLKAICSLLGVEYEAGMLDFYKTSRNHLSARHSKWIFKPLNKDNRYKWKKDLTQAEIKIFTLFAGYYLTKYNYEISSTRVDFSAILCIVRSLFIGLPNKIFELISRKKVFGKAIKKGKLKERV